MYPALNIATVGRGKTPVFCITGMFAGKWMWDDFFNYVDQDIFTFFCMEDAVSEIANNIEDVAQAITTTLNELGNKETIILGNSIGGVAALIVAAQNPNWISKAVIAGTPHGHINLGIGRPSRSDKQWIYKLAHKLLYRQDLYGDEKFENDLQKIFNLLTQDRTITLNNLRLARTLSEGSIEEYIKLVSSPIYAIWGEEDEITPLKEWHSINQTYENFSLYKINKCGHSPMYEQPEKFAQVFTSLMTVNP